MSMSDLARRLETTTMKNALAVFISLLAIPFALGQTPVIQSAPVTDYGTYAFDTQNVRTVEGGVEQRYVTNIRQLSTTRIVPFPKPGEQIHFGFHYTINGSPANTPVTVRNVVIYPKLLNVNGTMMPQNEATIERKIGYTYYRGWTIDSDNKDMLVPGDWTLEVWYGTQRLMSQTFTLVEGK
jgi:hypothetical protein